MKDGRKMELFVGINESQELGEMGALARKRGADVAGGWSLLAQKMQERAPERVEISGCHLGGCVRVLVWHALDLGVGEVIVDLRNSRIDGYDVGSSPSFHLARERMEVLLRSLGVVYKDDPRLIIRI